MAKSLTASLLIESVKSRAMLPNSTALTLNDDDFLRFANEELDNSLTPYVLSHHENYFLTHEIVPIVTSQTRYVIPYRALGNKLRDVSFMDANGNIYEMTQVLVEDESGSVSNYMAPIGGYFYKQFYVEGDEIVLPVDPNSITAGGFFKISYYSRCNELVAESRTVKIVSIDTNTGVITFSAAPSVFSASSLYDFVQAKTPHKTLGFDIPVTLLNATSITVDPADIPQRLSVGDYICLAEESPLPQIPVELHSMLAQRIACRCLDAIGDQQGLQSAIMKLAEMEAKAGSLLQNRVEGAPVKFNNRHSHLRQNRRFGFGRW